MNSVYALSFFMQVEIFLVGFMNELHLKWRHFKILCCEALTLTEPFWFSWPPLIAFQQGKGAGASSLIVIRVLGSTSPPWILRGRVKTWPCTRPPLTPSLGGEGRACDALVGGGADVWSPHRIPTDNRCRGSCYCPSRMKVLASYLAFPNTTFFTVVMYGCESWTVKKAEHWRIDAFELWCWRRLLRVPWTARRSNSPF